MPSTKKTAITVASGVFALGAGLGVAGLASADPTPTPTNPSATPSTPATPGQDRPGHPGGPGRGVRDDDLAQQLAGKLGVTEAKVVSALQAIRDDNKAANPPTGKPDPKTRPDPAAHDTELAKALASKLGLDEAKVKTALAEIRAERDAQRATALKDELAAAVKAGTLTQAEADAVQKAVNRGVIQVGPR